MKTENHNKQYKIQYIADIKAILNEAKQKVYAAVNSAIVQAYWLIGKRIVEDE